MSKKLEEIAADAAAEWIKNSTTNHSLANACALYGYNAGFLAGYKAAQEHAHAALEEAEARHEAYVVATEENFKQMEAKLDQLADADKVINSSNNSNGWISVKCHLPQPVNGQPALVLILWKGLGGWVHEIAYHYKSYYEWSNMLDEKIDNVHYWQELPEPPKEEE
jgi:hypothetical protein